MSGFLFTWNPKHFDWDEAAIARCVAASRRGLATRWEWSCARSHKPRRGDRAFLTKLGKLGRGIFASGTVVAGAHPAPPDSDFGPMQVLVSWDAFLDPGDTPARFDPSRIAHQHWTPESSGSQIDHRALAMLEARWADHLASRGAAMAPLADADADAMDDSDLQGLEGEVRDRVQIHRRRERALRTAKLASHRRIHGTLCCEICRFDFDRVYGVEYAEVHHLRPLGKLAGPTTMKLQDLAVLCANCHRVAHLDPARPRSLNELRALFARR